MQPLKRISFVLGAATLTATITAATPVLAEPSAADKAAYLRARASSLQSAATAYRTDELRQQLIAVEHYLRAIDLLAAGRVALNQGDRSMTAQHVSAAEHDLSAAQSAMDEARADNTQAARAAETAVALEARADGVMTAPAAPKAAPKTQPPPAEVKEKPKPAKPRPTEPST